MSSLNKPNPIQTLYILTYLIQNYFLCLGRHDFNKQRSYIGRQASCLEIKRCHFFIILIGATLFLCTYIVLKASSCVTFSLIFATRACIDCIDSGTCDMIRILLVLTIWFLLFRLIVTPLMRMYCSILSFNANLTQSYMYYILWVLTTGIT